MKKHVALCIAAVAVLLAIVLLYYSFLVRRSQAGIAPAGSEGDPVWLMFLSVIFAIVFGGWAVHRLIRFMPRISFFSSHELTVRASRVRLVITYLVAIVAFPFSLFVGFVAGGTLGGGWGDRLFGFPGAMIGIGLGIFSVTVLLAGAAAFIGFLIVSMMAGSAQKSRQ